FRVEIKNRVSASNRLLIARLLLTDLLGIERPCIICACWNKKQLDVVVSKLQFLPHEIWSIQAAANQVSRKLSTAGHRCLMGVSRLLVAGAWFLFTHITHYPFSF